MPATREDIIIQLQKDILALQGIKSPPGSMGERIDLGPMKTAFPNHRFPLGVIHEFICSKAEDGAVSGGFISGLLSTFTRSNGVSLWISSSRTLFPPALKAFGIEPDQVIFIDLQKDRDVLWAMEEALKCNALAAVIGEIKELSFTASRRLQLAVEQSRVTGFILRNNPRNVNTTASVARWRITSLASDVADEMPGVGFPRWNVELLKIRNGKPGTWQIEWVAGRFRHIFRLKPILKELQRKTG